MKFKNRHEKLPAPVSELQKSPSGRAYLAKKREERKIELLQPSDRDFKKVYGAETRKQDKVHEVKKKRSEDEWGALEEKREHDRRKREDAGYKKFH